MAGELEDDVADPAALRGGVRSDALDDAVLARLGTDALEDAWRRPVADRLLPERTADELSKPREGIGLSRRDGILNCPWHAIHSTRIEDETTGQGWALRKV